MQDGDVTGSSKASGHKVNGVHLLKIVAIQQQSNMSSVSEQQSTHQIASIGSRQLSLPTETIRFSWLTHESEF